jgi:hypothetical protein
MRSADRQLAELRARNDARLSVPTASGDFRAAARRLRRAERDLVGIADAWTAVIPPDLARRTALKGVRRGVLQVQVHDHAARYELDRLLRAGGTQRLLDACRAGFRSVRLTVAPIDGMPENDPEGYHRVTGTPNEEAEP